MRRQRSLVIDLKRVTRDVAPKTFKKIGQPNRQALVIERNGRYYGAVISVWSRAQELGRERVEAGWSSTTREEARARADKILVKLLRQDLTAVPSIDKARAKADDDRRHRSTAARNINRLFVTNGKRGLVGANR